ncbi:MAG: non-homologous end-joining DNA ligase [Actinomycetes bacterium]
MAEAGSEALVKVEGHELKLTNLPKVLYPEAGFTKGAVIDYYARIAPVLLPHLADRAITRKRWPEGVDGPPFFEKNLPKGTPEWVEHVVLDSPSSTKARDVVDYPLVTGLASLLWLANLAALELHVHQWRVRGAVAGPNAARATLGERENPDRLVVDLDPGAPAGLEACVEVAFATRERLAADGLETYPVTSGSKGLQLYAPISGQQPAEVVEDYAHRIAVEIERQLPELVVSRMTKSLRTGKVLFDWSQNHPRKTTVCPYSLRGSVLPTVATPHTWDELAEGSARQWRAEDVLARVDQVGDLLTPLFEPGPPLPQA